MVTKQPDEVLVERIPVAGHYYNVLARPNHMAPGQWIVTATECPGRWPLSRCETGDGYLDARLASAVADRME